MIDDVLCLGKIGFLRLDAPLSHSLARSSDIMWFTTIHLDLLQGFMDLKSMQRAVTLEQGSQKSSQDGEKTVHALKRKLRLQQLGLVKLLADYVFCGIDVFSLESGYGVSPRWQVWSGLASALLGTYKLGSKISPSN